jgi:hypothetical protein
VSNQVSSGCRVDIWGRSRWRITRAAAHRLRGLHEILVKLLRSLDSGREGGTAAFADQPECPRRAAYFRRSAAPDALSAGLLIWGRSCCGHVKAMRALPGCGRTGIGSGRGRSATASGSALGLSTMASCTDPNRAVDSGYVLRCIYGASARIRAQKTLFTCDNAGARYRD